MPLFSFVASAGRTKLKDYVGPAGQKYPPPASFSGKLEIEAIQVLFENYPRDTIPVDFSITEIQLRRLLVHFGKMGTVGDKSYITFLKEDLINSKLRAKAIRDCKSVVALILEKEHRKVLKIDGGREKVKSMISEYNILYSGRSAMIEIFSNIKL